MAEKKEKKIAKRFYEPTCSEEVEVFEWTIDEFGHHKMVVVGKKNIQDEIQLYKDECDIKILVDKMMKGDTATLIQLSKEGVYGDVNDFPKEYHPAAGAQALQQVYENQSDEIKAKFPTFELFAKYFTNLTEAMIADLGKPQEAPKEENVNE